MNKLESQRFGSLEVLHYNPQVRHVSKARGGHQWLGKWVCRCDCGKEVLVGTSQLTSGRTTSCGCQAKNKIKISPGTVFGRLTVQGREANTSSGKARWCCQCVCGNRVTVVSDKLSSGRQVSCGCLRRETKPSELRRSKQKEYFESHREKVFERFCEEFPGLTLATSLEEFKALQNPHLDILKWTCLEGHVFELRRSGLLQSPNCRSCYSYKSNAEIEIQDFLSTITKEKILQNTRSVLPEGLEIDIYLPAFKLAVEHNGLYWHTGGPKNRHQFKRQACERQGIFCMQIQSDEWIFKRSTITSMLRSRLNLSKQIIYARKTEVRTVGGSDAKEFQERTHLMGHHRSSKHVGLFFENSLVSLLSYKKKDTGLDISRFSTELDCTVAGGLGKLLSHIVKLEAPEFVHSWVDLRYGDGNSLIKNGFTREKEVLSWRWTDGRRTYNRLRCRANMDERNLPEKDYAQELGWKKLYDAGQALFVKAVKA